MQNGLRNLEKVTLFEASWHFWTEMDGIIVRRGLRVGVLTSRTPKNTVFRDQKRPHQSAKPKIIAQKSDANFPRLGGGFRRGRAGLSRMAGPTRQFWTSKRVIFEVFGGRPEVELSSVQDKMAILRVPGTPESGRFGPPEWLVGPAIHG